LSSANISSQLSSTFGLVVVAAGALDELPQQANLAFCTPTNATICTAQR